LGKGNIHPLQNEDERRDLVSSDPRRSQYQNLVQPVDLIDSGEELQSLLVRAWT
jgi:hypothetical protein